MRAPLQARGKLACGLRDPLLKGAYLHVAFGALKTVSLPCKICQCRDLAFQSLCDVTADAPEYAVLIVVLHSALSPLSASPDNVFNKL
jgi:hypothetical protein